MSNAPGLLVLLLGCCSLLGPVACRSQPPAPAADVALAEAPAELVSAHTNGVVGRKSTIHVHFVRDVVLPDQVGVALERAPFQFEPAIAGQATWTAANELTFVPSSELEPGQTYVGTVALASLLPAIPEARDFQLRLDVISQAFTPELAGLAADADATKQTMSGRLTLADEADPALVEKLLRVEHRKDALSVEWTHHPGGKDHAFVIRGIQRLEDGSKLALVFDGEPIGVDRREAHELDVPGLNQFLVSSIRAVTTGERHIEIRFSDPLLESQDLRGRITVEGRADAQIERDGSVVRIYSSSGWSDAESILLSGVRNAKNYALKQDQTFTVSFAPLVPSVRFATQGVILPSNTKQTLLIEATNVRAVWVEATRVYEKNVPQFLQVNGLDGASELSRVGKVVWSQRVEIEGAADAYNRVQRLGLDVSKLVKDNPSGLYRISMRFERPDILVDCPTPAWSDNDPDQALSWDDPQVEHSFWDFWGDSEGGEEPWSAYERRFDPCARSFYKKTDDHDITATHNVLVTDVGLIARMGTDGQLLAVVTDLVDATPIANADVELLDYQLQRIGGGRTDAAGTTRLDVKGERPFALVARHDGQTSWLRLDKGSSLAMSHFDVGGAAVTQGLKGYLYGERGIWRPGDDIYLTFVLHDASGRVPERHPAEFELENSRGQLIERRTITDSTDGFYRLSTSTAADAPTGNYTARVRVGGAVFEKVLRVETVVPNRLKIALGLSDKVRAADLHLKSTLESRWLHGAIAGGFHADIELALSPRPTSFDRYGDYSFDDPLASFAYEPATIWEGDLDKEGKAELDVDIPAPAGAPGLLTGTLRTRVFEPSGAFSVDEASVLVSPHTRYVGLQLPKGDAARGMLLTDVEHPTRLVLLDEDGAPVPTGELDCALYKIDWRWWWEKGSEDLAQYVESRSLTPLQSGVATVKNGVANWKFEVKYPDWGRYLVVAKDKNGTHRTGKIVYIDWPGWAGRAGADNPGGASVLSLSSDQKKVSVGEPVTLSFPMPRGSRALVSLETGSRVVSTSWVEPSEDADTAQYTFSATADMAPGVYANVTVIQPNASRANDAPIRLYGVTPVEVFDPATKITPKITTAAHFEPESTALVSVAETAGRPMTYTLAVVDEGLLGLTRFQTPNAWGSFYQREALGVRSWDLYDQVAGAYGGALEGLLSIGGDGAGLGGPQPQAQRFKPMVHYEGPFTLAAGETRQHKVHVPQYIGEVRVMVVAGHDGAFGAAERSVAVKKPLMVLASLPRVLGPQEEVELPVSVFALDSKIKDVTLSVETEGPVTIEGERRRSLHFSAVGDKMSTFKLRVSDAVGVAKVSVTATGGGITARQDVEIQVRHPGAPETTVLASAVAPGKSWLVDVALPGLPGSNSATLELSRVPPIDLGRRLDDLIRYPHGCVEQTTSAAFPQVYLSRLTELSPARAAEVEGHIRYAIARLRGYQNADGGFGYWPGERAHDWSTSYVGHFLLEAERAGYLLPAGMRSAWVKAQKERANRWVKDQTNADLDQAYRLYTLALAGQPDLSAMNRLSEVSLSTTARWRLAAAYLLAGQKVSAEAVIAKAGLEVVAYRELTGTFGSAARDEALILEALVLQGDQDRASRVATAVSAALTSGEAMNTQATAMSLVAMARFATIGGTSAAIEASWSLNGGTAVPVRSTRPIHQIPVPVAQTGTPKIMVQNRAKEPLYARVITRGTPPLGQEREEDHGLDLNVSYLLPGGGSTDVSHTEHGADLVAHVTITNTSGMRLDEIALSHILPSGWQVGALSPGAGEGFQYRDVRDDRVYTYFDLDVGQTLELDVPVNASYAGRYYLPPIHVETMYDASIYAREAGTWIQVAPLPEG